LVETSVEYFEIYVATVAHARPYSDRTAILLRSLQNTADCVFLVRLSSDQYAALPVINSHVHFVAEDDVAPLLLGPCFERLAESSALLNVAFRETRFSDGNFAF
jgi:hypothetical protein